MHKYSSRVMLIIFTDIGYMIGQITISDMLTAYEMARVCSILFELCKHIG